MRVLVPHSVGHNDADTMHNKDVDQQWLFAYHVVAFGVYIFDRMLRGAEVHGVLLHGFVACGISNV